MRVLFVAFAAVVLAPGVPFAQTPTRMQQMCIAFSRASADISFGKYHRVFSVNQTRGSDTFDVEVDFEVRDAFQMEVRHRGICKFAIPTGEQFDVHKVGEAPPISLAVTDQWQRTRSVSPQRLLELFKQFQQGAL
jgi:hypothetical protein